MKPTRFWAKQYVIAVQRGSKTRYFYGTHLKEALKVAGLRQNERFSYARFDRAAVHRAEWHDGSYSVSV
jgi:hypothetical protein